MRTTQNPLPTYDRDLAVTYARRWALSRNPAYGDFSGIGGDCANFASQCLYAGCGVMNYTPTMGWYFVGMNNRAPAWSGVAELYNFLVHNQGPGPQAQETTLDALAPGDLIQAATTLPYYHHTLVVTGIGDPTDPEQVLICAHSYDSRDRPLASYAITQMRCLHIVGVGR